MRKQNSMLVHEARESLRGKWDVAVLSTLVFMLIITAAGVIPIVGQIGVLVIAGPLTLGYVMICMTISRQGQPEVKQLFDGFSLIGNAIVIYILRSILIGIGLFLLIIPGIYLACALSMSYLIYTDDTSLTGIEAMKKSHEMMKGNKWKYFCLILRFIGWCLVAFLTFGIGFLWLIPYVQVATVKFYEDIKSEQIANESNINVIQE